MLVVTQGIVINIALYEINEMIIQSFEEWFDVHYPSLVRIELSFVDPDQPNEPFVVHKDIFVPAGSWVAMAQQ